MRCADAHSAALDTRDAARCVAEGLSAALAGPADLVLVFATPHHAEGMGSIRETLIDRAGARHVVGCTVSGTVGGGREHEAGPGIVGFGLRGDGLTIEPFVGTVEKEGEDSARILGLPFDSLASGPERAALLFADPYSFPVEPVLRFAREHAGRAPWIGGIASGGSAPGVNRMLCDDTVVDHGAVGVVLGGEVRVTPLVSQGCRPIGRHFVITKAKDNVIEELGGGPALARLQETIESLTEEERARFVRGLHLGRVVDEYKSSFVSGDFLVRSVIGVDRSRGAIAINDHVRRGSTVQFMVRDPVSATEELEFLLDRARRDASEPPIRGALLFTCTGRGTHMFADADHDVSRIRAGTPPIPTAGFFAAGEIGPIGADTYLHGFTASVALLRARDE